MKIFNTSEYSDKLKIRPVNPSSLIGYNYFPETEKELIEIIDRRVHDEGYECDLNDIDTSKITDMSNLFDHFYHLDIDTKLFNGDVSKWDVSSVTNMSFMFSGAISFNANISGWNTSNVTDMRFMFNNAKKFNQDLSNWDNKKVGFTHYIFDGCPLENNKEKQPVFNK